MRTQERRDFQLTILYVEDEDVTREILSSMIQSRFPSARLFSAANGRAGLDLFAQCRADIVITDIHMPQMDGLEMVQQIKKEAPQVKVIIMTAFNDIKSTLRCIELGVNQYVVKPVDQRTLQAAIEKCRDSVFMRYLVTRQNDHIRLLNTELEARAADLEAANRELQAFNYTVSHDLRTPLTVINGYSQLLQEKAGDSLNAECRAYLGEISKGINRMSGIIGALLDLSRASRQDMQVCPVDLSREADLIVRNMVIADRSDRAVDCRIAPGLEATGDCSLLRQALENLLGNAWKYTGRREKALIEFGMQKEGERKVYFVRDNGAGFEQSEADRLFMPFQRLHDSEQFPGSGIGLATVQRIIHRHGGEIWAEGKSGEGATFYFTLGRDGGSQSAGDRMT